MRPSRLHRLLAAALLAVGLLLATLGWLLTTTAGARLVLATVPRWFALELRAEQVSGRLIDKLTLDGVTSRWPDGRLRIEQIRLRWQPLALLKGQIRVTSLELRGGALQLATGTEAETVEPLRLHWPRLSGWPLQLRGEIGRLAVDGFTLTVDDTEMLRLERFDTRADWLGGILTLNAMQLRLALPQLQAAGRLVLDFAGPGLRAILTGEIPLHDTAATPLPLTLDLDLAPAAAPALLRGFLRLASGAQPPHLPPLLLIATLELRDTALLLERFDLTSPGRPGEVSGQGTLELGGGPMLRLQAQFAGLDLEPETGFATNLGGTLSMRFEAKGYQGEYTVTNSAAGWREAQLAGSFDGDAAGLRLPGLAGRWLRGTVQGDLALDWRQGFALAGALRGDRLDPALLHPQWPGRINLDVDGRLLLANGQPLQAELNGRLRDSRLRGRELTGEVQAQLTGDDLHLERAQLKGDGFDLSASGRLRQQVKFRASVERLGALLPEASGQLRAGGWLRWQEGQLAGRLTADGRQFGYRSLRLEAFDLSAEVAATAPQLTFAFRGRGLAWAQQTLEQIELGLQGAPGDHRITLALRRPDALLRATARGGYGDGRWQGELTSFSGEEADLGRWRLEQPVPVTLAADRLQLSPAVFLGGREGRVRLAADVRLQPLLGSAQVDWQGIRLDHLNPWLEGATVTGRSGGVVEIRWLPQDRLELTARVEAAAGLTLPAAALALEFERAVLEVKGDSQGQTAVLELMLRDGGGVTGRFASGEPAQLALPQTGDLFLGWENIDLTLLQPLLPEGIEAAGSLTGRLTGRLLPEQRLDLDGRIRIVDGHLDWHTGTGLLSAPLRTAELTLGWRGERLTGELELLLAETGRAQGSFSLPLPARLPTRMLPDGPLRLALTAAVEEMGLLTALFPGMVQDSAGHLTLDLKASGGWSQPELTGTLHLTGAGAFLPIAGIRLEGMELQARFAGEQILIDSFQVRSDPGSLSGSGEIQLEQWRPASWRAEIRGERFRAVHLPELELLVSPTLALAGDRERVTVRGEVSIPQLLVAGTAVKAPVQPSPDVVLIGPDVPRQRDFPLALDLQVRVLLGDAVLVKMAGVDARLTGDVTLLATGLKDIRGQGRISVAEGSYAAYGVNLHISRGSLLFAGGPVNRPTLDVLATRKTGDITTGILIAGSPPNPRVTLYSDPAMPDTDTLAYMVLGHPLGADSGQANLLLLAAGGLLSKGESVVLQERIKTSLGLDVISVETGAGDVQQSMVTIGKYLRPDLYISIGQSVFTNVREFRLRYDISRRWQLESSLGTESGVDLFYKIEFR